MLEQDDLEDELSFSRFYFYRLHTEFSPYRGGARSHGSSLESKPTPDLPARAPPTLQVPTVLSVLPTSHFDPSILKQFHLFETSFIFTNRKSLVRSLQPQVTSSNS